jgi:hypothetical protein
LVATNSDASYPAPDGLWPGAGAILAAVTTATGATPTVVGKPNRPLLEAAAERTGARRPLMVGDRIDTDVVGAARMGWDSLLVLTGAARAEDVGRAVSLPTYVAPDLSALLSAIPPARPRLAGPGDVAAIAALLELSGLSGAAGPDRINGTLVIPRGDASGSQPIEAPRTAAPHIPAPHTPAPLDSGEPILATASLDDLGGYGLLRSVAVHPEVRGAGMGMLIVAAALHLAHDRGLRRVALFTETAERFFERLGFSRVEREELPEPVRSSRQALEECSVSAVAMLIDL